MSTNDFQSKNTKENSKDTLNGSSYQKVSNDPQALTAIDQSKQYQTDIAFLDQVKSIFADQRKVIGAMAKDGIKLASTTIVKYPLYSVLGSLAVGILAGFSFSLIKRTK